MNDQTEQKEKRTVALEEYKAIKAQLLSNHNDLQKVIVYTLGLSSLAIALVSKAAGVASLEVTRSGAMLIAVVFLMLSLNYIGLMRNYLNLLRYLSRVRLTVISTFVADDLDHRNYGDVGSVTSLLRWEEYNRDFYRSVLSKSVLYMTFCVQPLFPFFFACVSMYYAFRENLSSFSPRVFAYSVVAVVGIVFVMCLACLCFAVLELNRDIRSKA